MNCGGWSFLQKIHRLSLPESQGEMGAVGLPSSDQNRRERENLILLKKLFSYLQEAVNFIIKSDAVGKIITAALFTSLVTSVATFAVGSAFVLNSVDADMAKLKQTFMSDFDADIVEFLSLKKKPSISCKKEYLKIENSSYIILLNNAGAVVDYAPDSDIFKRDYDYSDSKDIAVRKVSNPVSTRTNSIEISEVTDQGFVCIMGINEKLFSYLNSAGHMKASSILDIENLLSYPDLTSNEINQLTNTKIGYALRDGWRIGFVGDNLCFLKVIPFNFYFLRCYSIGIIRLSEDMSLFFVGFVVMFIIIYLFFTGFYNRFRKGDA